MTNKPLIFFASLMLLALIIVVYYQIETNPFKNATEVQTQEQANPHASDEGMALYGQYCASCHGGFGEGTGKNPPLKETKLDHGQIHDIIRTGKGIMPAYPDLTEQQVHQVVLFVEKLK